MKLRLLLASVALLVLISVLVAPTVIEATAPRTVSYDVSWWTIDGGGAQGLTGGTYSLSGTIGQPDASLRGAGTYSVGGGFWPDMQDFFRIFAPLIQRGN